MAANPDIRYKDPGRGRDFRYIAVCLIIVALAVLGGCKGQTKPDQLVVEPGESDGAVQSTIRYAKGFRLESDGGVACLVLTDPERRGTKIARYRFISSPDKPVNPKPGYTDIAVPVKNLAASSTTHAGFLSALGAGDQLMGCNNPERLYDTLLFNRFQRGELIKMGRDLEYNLEFLVASRPDLVLQTGIDGQFTADSRLTELNIPVMFVLEWMESTPLGRAEWIKVFGLITGRVREADSLFSLIEKEYLALADLGHQAPEKVKVLTGNVFKGTWYMPGGRNYMTRFFEDAGMDYLYRDSDQSASLALSFESVVYRLAEAPVWINVNVDSLSQLLTAGPRYAAFRAVKERRVYSISNRINSHGGNDFWEGGVVRPDLVLADLLAIAHPELVPNHSWNFYKPLVFNQ